MKLILTASTAAALLAAAISADAADFPKIGSAEYDTYYVFETWPPSIPKWEQEQ